MRFLPYRGVERHYLICCGRDLSRTTCRHPDGKAFMSGCFAVFHTLKEFAS